MKEHTDVLLAALEAEMDALEAVHEALINWQKHLEEMLGNI